VTAEQAIDAKKESGYDGMILVNHCQSWYYPPAEHKDYIKRVINEYRRTAEYGDKVGFRVFFGLEVSIDKPAYNDWLLYCVTEKFLLSTPCLYQLSQKELYRLCLDNGVALAQAHPFRNSGWGDNEYMCGTEINATPCDLARAEETLDIARKRGLFVTCGTDYHGDERPKKGGIYLPETLRTSEDVSNYLLTAKTTEIFLDEEDITVPGMNK
ncbi:MAG: hypothetical protein J6Z34_07500, partial [Clostridia bacterium]|nr:hypothetical protein [Clostridia bacterium]